MGTVQTVRKDTARRQRRVIVPRKRSTEPRVRRLYHVTRDSWIVCTLLAIFCAMSMLSCAVNTASDPLRERGEHMWTKARVDLLVEASRERVLLGRYAELQEDHERAARFYHEAWCFDREAAWLQEKRAHYIQEGILADSARCYAQPTSL